MTVLAALLLQAAAPPTPALPPPVPPADWTSLPQLPVAAPPGTAASSFVRREVAENRCRAAVAGGVAEIESSVAVLVDEEGDVQRVVPHAINCPTVEQYTAGFVSSLARRASGLKPGWYKYTMVYRWQG